MPENGWTVEAEKLMKIIFYLLLFVVLVPSANGQARKELYLDEGKIEISKRIYNKKLRSDLYYGQRYANDSLIYNVLYLSYYFDKIKKPQKEQLFKLLVQRNKVDTTKTILIHYENILKPIDEFPKNDTVLYYKNGTHSHLISHRTFIDGHKKCNNTKRKNSTVYHFFAENEGHPLSFEDQKWYEDNLLLLKNTFGNGKESKRNWSLIIHPSGDFAVRNAELDYRIWNRLVDRIKWDKIKKKFDKKFNKLNP